MFADPLFQAGPPQGEAGTSLVASRFLDVLRCLLRLLSKEFAEGKGREGLRGRAEGKGEMGKVKVPPQLRRCNLAGTPRDSNPYTLTPTTLCTP